ncbi:MAG: hypothetical protein KM312_09615 [Hydrogenibacillus schlegelii]|uniref:Uncharacterized protein n=1 Tax=Hydrogenibacillus schlegelii TaxID=1484 RepID=A0A947D2H8_HYDSH|nr:hypothetical protein [Hydrogenibacillus schlegelii]
MVFDREGRALGAGRRPIRQHDPRPGRGEHDSAVPAGKCVLGGGSRGAASRATKGRRALRRRQIGEGSEWRSWASTSGRRGCGRSSSARTGCRSPKVGRRFRHRTVRCRAGWSSRRRRGGRRWNGRCGRRFRRTAPMGRAKRRPEAAGRRRAPGQRRRRVRRWCAPG